MPRDSFTGSQYVAGLTRTVDPPGTLRRATLRPLDPLGTGPVPVWFPMAVAEGQLTATPPEGSPAVRVRGDTNPQTGPAGIWTFTAGPAGATYYCVQPRAPLAYARETFDLAAGAQISPVPGAAETLAVLCEGALTPAGRAEIAAPAVLNITVQTALTAGAAGAFGLILRR